MKQVLVLMTTILLLGCGESAGDLRGIGDDLSSPLGGVPSPGSGGAVNPEPPVTPPPPAPPVAPGTKFIPFAWDGKNAKAQDWNTYAYEAIAAKGPSLLTTTPQDIAAYCPQFDKLNDEGRIMFWISLLAAVVKHESSFDPDRSQVVNGPLGNIVKRGLLMLDFDRAEVHKCNVKNSQDLAKPQINLECAVTMLEYWISTEKNISRLVSGSYQGAARVWPSLQSGSSLQDIKSITSTSEVCM